MGYRALLPLLIGFALLGPAPRAVADFQVPALTGPVVDDAGILDGATRQALDNALHALVQQGGSQINVLTVKSLDGLSIEQASIQVVDKWKLGGRKVDNGVLFLIAPNDRRLRIEVGQGLEGSLTDADSKRIIDESVRPLFRSGDFNSGTIVGVYQIARKTDPSVDLTPYLEGHVKRSSRNQAGEHPIGFTLFLFFLLIVFIATRRRRFGPGIFYGGGGGWGGGGWGGGSGGSGGGWSGGGGGFSGGGASGDW